MLSLSSVGFFKRGDTLECLICEAKEPLASDMFTIDVIYVASFFKLSCWGLGLSQMSWQEQPHKTMHLMFCDWSQIM